MNDRPRQHFPGENEPRNDATQQFDRYQDFSYNSSYANNSYGNSYGGQDYEPQYEPEQEKRGPGTLAMVMSVLFLLALVAAGIFYFMWQDLASQPDPEPVTVTETTVESSTVTVTEEGQPLQIPSEIPSNIPTEIPSELPDIDVEGWLNDLFGGNEAEPAPEPAPAF